jgi:hypothetical protein
MAKNDLQGALDLLILKTLLHLDCVDDRRPGTELLLMN